MVKAVFTSFAAGQVTGRARRLLDLTLWRENFSTIIYAMLKITQAFRGLSTRQRFCLAWSKKMKESSVILLGHDPGVSRDPSAD
jgi:hypothetical protein